MMYGYLSYLNISLNRDAFHFERSSGPEGSLETLEKIQKIVMNKIQYEGVEGDEFASWNRKYLLTFLEAKTEAIAASYERHAKRFPWVMRKLFGIAQKQRKIRGCSAKIRNLLRPPHPFGTHFLPKVNIQQILSYLNPQELSQFSQANQSARAPAEEIFVRQVQELGFKGEDPHAAKLYFQSLLKEVKQIRPYIRDYLVMKSLGRVDCHATLLNLKNLNAEEIVVLLQNRAYGGFVSLPKLSLFLLKNTETFLCRPFKQGFQTTVDDAFTIAVKSGETEVVELLFRVSHKYKVNLSELLFSAIYANQKDMIPYLLKRGARLDLLDSNGDTPLETAILCRRYACAKTLIQEGADVNIQNKKQSTPLMRALVQGDTKMVSLLLQSGAKKSIEAWNQYDNSALSIAIKTGDVVTVKLLLESGAIPSSVRPKTAETPLHTAIREGPRKYRREVILLLLKYGADMQQMDNTGETPYQLCMKEGRILKNIAKQFC